MAWINKTKNKIVLVLAALIFAGALFGVIWGVTHHTEEVFMEVCWNGSKVDYASETEVKSQPCATQLEKPSYTKEQIPLTVFPIANNTTMLYVDDRDSKILQEAIRDVNSQFGFELFKMVYGQEAMHKDGRIKASVIVHTQVAYTPGDRALSSKVPAWAIHSRRPDGMTQCDIHIRGGLSERYMYRAAVHELGHAVWLAHDNDNPGSVMFPITEDDTTAEHMLPSRFTDTDRGAVRQLYSQEK